MKKILTFNLSRSAEAAVKRAAAVNKLRVTAVDKSLYDTALRDISGSAEGSYAGEAPDKSMIIMCGLGSGNMNSVLTMLKKSGADITYKAVLTETNAAWTPLKMFEEMELERLAVEQARLSNQ